MYSTCLSCHAPLGTNEVVERLPVGRRLAFDADKGRLWVVCTKCGRWNLTPLEERWEAIEQCERLFRDTRLRASTDNIGLAKRREGLELVRVGRPERVELAAWRYGGVIRRRRNRALVVGGTVGAVGLGIHVAVGMSHLLVGPLGAALSGMLLQTPTMARNIARARRTIGRVTGDDGKVREVLGRNASGAQLVRTDAGRWGLVLPLAGGHAATLTGEEAMRAARFLLPHLNSRGGGRGLVRAAIGELGAVGDAERYFQQAAERAAENERTDRSMPYAFLGMRGYRFRFLEALRPEVRLALEMAAHDEQERRALEGELAGLEAAWKEAEEIAAIADDLFLPPRVGDFIRKHRRQS